ncbi:MAG: hypothetical protein QG675_595 [Patescibacteria group bacterium]|jgi:hypothetical protein|nr:hypothetical protein [Patescibacteria group bacterium]
MLIIILESPTIDKLLTEHQLAMIGGWLREQVIALVSIASISEIIVSISVLILEHYL